MPRSRRQFLTQSLATIAAGSIAPHATAANNNDDTADAIAQPLIDTNVYFGHWPHARFASEEPRELVAQLRASNVTQAWVGSFDALFHKDIAAVNERLAAACATNPMLVPFGAVNPTLPDWEDDLRRCRETHRMPGIRLHPNHHNYDLNDPRFARLLELAAHHGLMVQLITWLDDAKHRWLKPTVNEVDLTPLIDQNGTLAKRMRHSTGQGTPKETAALMASFPRLLITGARPTKITELADKLPTDSPVYFDLSRLSTADELTTVATHTDSIPIVFGSGFPLHAIEIERSLLADANLTDKQRSMIAFRAAARALRTPS